MNPPKRAQPFTPIEKLGSPKALERQGAARAIFALGSRQALARAEAWLRDPEMADLVVLEAQRTPKLTVGVAVQPETFQRIRAAHGSPPLATLPEDIDALEFELEFPGGARLDILTTRQAQEQAPITRFLKKFGEGIQQVELEVKDVERASEILRQKFGLLSAYRSAREGANSTKVNFFLVADPSGAKMLIELVETGGNETRGTKRQP